MRGTGVDTLSLYKKRLGQQEKLIWKLTGSQTSKDEWRRAAIAIDSASSMDFYMLIMEGKAFGKDSSDIAIDDIVMQLNQYCQTDPVEADVNSVTFTTPTSTRTPPHNNNSMTSYKTFKLALIPSVSKPLFSDHKSQSNSSVLIRE